MYVLSRRKICFWSLSGDQSLQVLSFIERAREKECSEKFESVRDVDGSVVCVVSYGFGRVGCCKIQKIVRSKRPRMSKTGAIGLVGVRMLPKNPACQNLQDSWVLHQQKPALRERSREQKHPWARENPAENPANSRT